VEIITKKKMMLFSGTIHPALGAEIAECLAIPVSRCEIRRFASGEIYFRSEESVRGADVFVVQSHYEPINEALMEQLLMIDAMKRASAKRISAVIPYYGYSRQDKKALSREPISAKLVAGEEAPEEAAEVEEAAAEAAEGAEGEAVEGAEGEEGAAAEAGEGAPGGGEADATGGDGES
jgi:hypothetical protein